MVLLNGLLLDHNAAAVGSGLADDGLAGFQHREPGGQIIHAGLGEPARQGHHNGLRAVMAVLVLPQPGPVHLFQGGFFAQNGPGQRGTLKDHPGQPFGAQVLGVVLVHSDFLQNDPTLGLHIAVVKFGVEEHIAQDVGR